VDALARSPALFPAFVGQHSLTLDGAGTPGAGGPGQHERLAGRICAREALRRCAPEHADAPIPSGRHREPVWPADIVGSITHTRRFASAAVARRADARGIGLDFEDIVTDEVAARIAPTVAAADEIAALVRATGWGLGAVVTLVFSAKEALYKCLFPAVGRYFDFLDARLDDVDVARATFRARLLGALGPGFRAGHTLEGRFERAPEAICTATLLPP
jgi:enterobactin synthetase component D